MLCYAGFHRHIFVFFFEVDFSAHFIRILARRLNRLQGMYMPLRAVYALTSTLTIALAKVHATTVRDDA
jgi:hypothetical protein